MSTVTTIPGPRQEILNIAATLSESARRYPLQRAVVFPAGRDRAGRATYSQLTFQQLDQESDRLARGLRGLGVTRGTRIVLMVRPSLEFIALTYALFKAGAVVVLIDPGMGRSGVFRCLDEVEPQGFVAIPLVQAVRWFSGRRFRHARINVTVGGTALFGGTTYRRLLGEAWEPFAIEPTRSSDSAAIIFTSGSTGPPKGVLYEHGMFAAQVNQLRDFYGIQPGEIDLPGFPLFALFNAAMGVTTVVPDMDPTRPAQVDPRRILEAIANQGVTQAFGSPAIWNRVGRHCEQAGMAIPALKRVLSAGAPVPIPVIQRMRAAFAETGADIHTPYGATEALPVCSISGREILEQTAPLTRQGAGTCVGRRFPGMSVRIVEITDGPIADISQVRELPRGEIGEILVRGAVVTREYFRQPAATLAAKIPDGDTFWHRMGDVGYLDAEDRLWFCGRKAHIVETPRGRLFTIRCEAIFNQHPRIFRCALVGVGDKPQQRPVIVAEPEAGQFPANAGDVARLTAELLALGRANALTADIDTILFHRALPVDIRHNVKIFREKLVPWAARRLP